MKPGQGAGMLLADAQRLTRAQIREKWLAGDYGKPGERPRPEWVDFSLKMQGK
jgi:hypothetical protein